MIEFLKENYANLFSLLNIFVLIITLCVLLRYAYDTKLIAEQAKEGNLRPVILRSGYVNGWDDVKSRTIKVVPKEKIDEFISRKNIKQNMEEMKKTNQPVPLHFVILKNIATDISGFVIVDGYKYTLLFGSEISQTKYDEKLSSMAYNSNWGWMKADTIIYALLDARTMVKSNEDNQIFITYKDIEGTSYYTKENKDFSQKSFPLKDKKK